MKDEKVYERESSDQKDHRDGRYDLAAILQAYGLENVNPIWVSPRRLVRLREPKC